MKICGASLKDLDEIASMEVLCFPPAEAASRESFDVRLSTFPECFWLMRDDSSDGSPIVSFVNGMYTDSENLTDGMYSGSGLYSPGGAWLMIFGVGTRPDYRHRGLASLLLKSALRDAESSGKLGAVLTCKEPLLGFYGRVGFLSEGISSSSHGGAVWYQMRIRF